MVSKKILERNTTAFWEDLLGEEKILSDNEAEQLQEVVHRLRKEYGFLRIKENIYKLTLVLMNLWKQS